MPEPDLVIEHPSVGATYRHDTYGVYQYDTYPEDSVLGGQERRRNLGEYDTLEEAQAEHPGARFTEGSGFREIPLPIAPPPWFDPMNAGEVWHEDDY